MDSKVPQISPRIGLLFLPTDVLNILGTYLNADSRWILRYVCRKLRQLSIGTKKPPLFRSNTAKLGYFALARWALPNEFKWKQSSEVQFNVKFNRPGGPYCRLKNMQLVVTVNKIPLNTSWVVIPNTLFEHQAREVTVQDEGPEKVTENHSIVNLNLLDNIVLQLLVYVGCPSSSSWHVRMRAHYDDKLNYDPCCCAAVCVYEFDVNNSNANSNKKPSYGNFTTDCGSDDFIEEGCGWY